MKKGLWLGMVGTLVALVAQVVPSRGQIAIIPQEAVQRAANPQTLQGSTLSFENDGTLSFGTIGEDDAPWQGEISWRNTSGQKLSITRITTSCNCLVAEWDRKANTATTSGKVGVKYYPKGRAGGVCQRLFVYTTLSDSEPSAIVEVEGTVTHSTDRTGDYPHQMGTLRLRQKSVAFPAEGGTARIAIINGGSGALSIAHDEGLTTGGVRAYTEPARLATGQEGDLVIEYRPEQGALPTLYLKGINTAPRKRKVEITIEK